ncbi:flagellar assembly protein FliW [Microterricola viridarii]|uniref:Flagellar assembly factor FliW n=1 Tax=Microterricola viridarii TaxID=412690 RepID=A0A1H1W6G9_9MICO|nr:flagellar assembly protein FliW [Microterricola viridarii]SDS92673.1 flagellar assembly factor FliW [Microterricola viridarii]
MSALSFVASPPGFEPSLQFEFAPVPDSVGLYTLTAADDAARRVFVVDAAIYLPDYAPSLSTQQGESLGLRSGADAQVYVVANAAESGTTVNLLAPIVVNAATNTAAQFILDGDWPLRAPLGA